VSSLTGWEIFERGGSVCHRGPSALSRSSPCWGASYVLSGVVQLASPEQTDPFSRASDHLIQGLLALSFLLALAGFVALHLRQAGNYGGPRGWTGFRAGFVGQGAMLVSAVASFLASGSLP